MSVSQEFSKLSLTADGNDEPDARRVQLNEPSTGDDQSCIKAEHKVNSSEKEDGDAYVEDDEKHDVMSVKTKSPNKAISSSSLGFTDDQFEFIDEPANDPTALIEGEEKDTLPPHPTPDGVTNNSPSEVNVETNTDNDPCPDLSEGRASELDYNFLDETDRSENRSDSGHCVKEDDFADQSEASTSPSSVSPKSEGRVKSRAPPPPPFAPGQHRCSSVSHSGQCVSRPACPSALVKYSYHHPHKIRFLQLSYNTNLRKPPDNWLRMKHRYHGEHPGSSKQFGSSSFWSYPFSKNSSWSMFSSFRYGSGYYNSSSSIRSKRYSHSLWSKYGPKVGRDFLNMKNFDQGQCQCCGCCNCSLTNQNCCCCCYHCVHTTSSCQRSDLLKLVPVTGNQSLSSPTPASILKKGSKKLSFKKTTKIPKRIAPEPVAGDTDGGPSVVKSASQESDEQQSTSEQKELIKERGV
ncbi:hypothetical protein HDE_13067 [Halotydeus destructor]|nr:hypothetical protein HDE_13067 [Halotydeus destructor]